MPRLIALKHKNELQCLGCEETRKRCFPIKTIKHKLENGGRVFSSFSQLSSNSPLQKLCGECVRTSGAVISGIVWQPLNNHK